MRTRRRVIENMEESTSEQGEKYLRTRKRGRGRGEYSRTKFKVVENKKEST